RLGVGRIEWPVIPPTDEDAEFPGGGGQQQAEAHRGGERRATGGARLGRLGVVEASGVALLVKRVVGVRVGLLVRNGFGRDEEAGEVPAGRGLWQNFVVQR